MEKVKVDNSFWNEITISQEELNCQLFESIGEFYEVEIPDQVLRTLISRYCSLLKFKAEAIDTFLEFNKGKCILTINGFSLSTDFWYRKEIELISDKIKSVYEKLTVDF